MDELVSLQFSPWNKNNTYSADLCNLLFLLIPLSFDVLAPLYSKPFNMKKLNNPYFVLLCIVTFLTSWSLTRSITLSCIGTLSHRVINCVIEPFFLSVFCYFPLFFRNTWGFWFGSKLESHYLFETKNMKADLCFVSGHSSSLFLDNLFMYRSATGWRQFPLFGLYSVHNHIMHHNP